MPGAFLPNVARLTQHGAVEYGTDGQPVSASDTYTVLVADPDARLVVASLTGLPAIGSAHPLAADLVLVGYRVEDHEVGRLFRRIVADYEIPGTEESGGGGGGEPPSPIGLLTQLDYPAYTQSGDLVADALTGAPVQNAAGEVFDSVPQVEQIWTGVHFVRRVESFPGSILALAGTVNSVAVTAYGKSFAPRTARLRATCRHTFDGSRRPWELDITLEPRHTLVNGESLLPDGVAAAMGYATVAGNLDIGWDVAIAECGYQYRLTDETGTHLVRFMTKDERGVESAAQLPQKLTAQGGDGRGYNNMVYLVVRTAQGNDWTALNLKSDAPDSDPAPTPTPTSN